ncbi:MAG: hypothetical protein ACFFEM_15905, partial [Candidatus Thorarchaeota archaeon]
FSLSYRDERLIASLTIFRCGVVYDDGRERVGVACGRFTHYFAPSKRRPKEKSTEKKKKDTGRKGARKRKRLPLRVMVRIVKAAVIFAAEMLSRIRYDGGRLEVVPVLADPALAGMTYGWGQAVYGAFPGLRQTISVKPTYGRGKSTVSGYVTLSVRNGSVIGPLWRLLWNLPIKKIIQNRFTGRGG